MFFTHSQCWEHWYFRIFLQEISHHWPECWKHAYSETSFSLLPPANIYCIILFFYRLFLITSFIIVSLFSMIKFSVETENTEVWILLDDVLCVWGFVISSPLKYFVLLLNGNLFYHWFQKIFASYWYFTQFCKNHGRINNI